jgi:type IV secretion system protein VirD4
VDIVAPMPKDSGSNTYFYQQAQAFLKGYILLFLDHGIPREQFDMFLVSYNAKMLGDNLYVLLQTLPKDNMSKRYLSELESDSGINESIKSVISTMNNFLNIFLNQNIKKITSNSNIDFQKVIDEKTIIFVNIDTSASSAADTNKIAILFMQSLYQHINDHLSIKMLEAHEKPILYIVDEFGNLPKMEFIPKIFSLDRGKNIMALIIIQSRSQLIEIYGEHKTRELIDSSQSITICSLYDIEFAQQLSRMSGTTVKRQSSYQMGRGAGPEGKSKSETISEQKVASVDENEFINKAKNEFIIFITGKKPYKFKFLPF